MSIELTLPSTLHPSYYERVRQDPRLGPALDHELIPALTGEGSVEERVARFTEAREAALQALAEAEARGEPVASPEEATRTSFGPAPAADALRDTFDRVCVDVLVGFFKAEAQRISAGPGSVEERTAALERLEQLALASFSWSPRSASKARVQVYIVRQGLEEREAH